MEVAQNHSSNGDPTLSLKLNPVVRNDLEYLAWKDQSRIFGNYSVLTSEKFPIDLGFQYSKWMLTYGIRNLGIK